MAQKGNIAIMGFQLESNSHSPDCEASEFFTLTGEDFMADVALPAPASPREVPAFIAEIAKEGYGHHALSVAVAGASGRMPQDYLDAWINNAIDRLKAVMPVAGVYLCQHGAALATRSEDPDGDFFRRVRDVVGDDIPIVVTLDPHANVTERMISPIDAVIAWQTNPHIDQKERGIEAAQLMASLLGGVQTDLAITKLPMIPPSISQVTEGGPLGEHIAYAQSFVGGDIMAACLCSGFSLGDCTKAGMSIVITSRRGQLHAAQEVADRVAQRIWNERHRYDITMTSLDAAVALMKEREADPSLPPLCYADVADNPGSGGRGNTTYILKAFAEAGCQDAILAPFYDAPLARTARAAGIGAEFQAHFNTEERSPYSEELTLPAKVIAIGGGTVVGRRGMSEGRSFDLGDCAVIQCGGIRILVSTRRFQFIDPVVIEHFGLSLSDTRALIVKSRGHFRAAVDEVFKAPQVIEVDVPGLATPMLHRINFQRTPRPIYPLDRELIWSTEQ